MNILAFKMSVAAAWLAFGGVQFEKGVLTPDRPPVMAIQFAPDHPLPCVYLDEPLVVEFSAPRGRTRNLLGGKRDDSDVTARARLEIVRQTTGPPAAHAAPGAPTSIDLGRITVRRGGTLWRTVEGAPAERGYYQVKALLSFAGSTKELTSGYCRVERPLAGTTVPIGVSLGPPSSSTSGGAADAQHPADAPYPVDDAALAAIKGIPVRSVRLDARLPEMPLAIEKAAKLGIQVAVALDFEALDDVEARAESLAKAFSESIICWHVSTGTKFEMLDPVVKAIRRGGSRAPIALQTPGPQALVALLEAGAGRLVSGLELTNASPGSLELSLFREALEQAGHETIPICAAGPLDAASSSRPNPDVLGTRLPRQLVLNWAAGLSISFFDMADVCPKGQADPRREATPCYAYLSALTRRLNGAVYVGRFPLPAPGHGEVFRNGETWLVVVWTPGDQKDLYLPLGAPDEVSAFDAFGNPLPAPALSEGAASMHVDAAPKYMAGRGGDVLLRAAIGMAHADAEVFIGNDAFKEQLSPELRAAIKAIADKTDQMGDAPSDSSELKSAKPDRAGFFALLRMFPYLEQQWHTGKLPQGTAVSAMRSLSSLARRLCTAEQEVGDPFIEPLKNTVAQCSDFQARYMMNAAGAPAGTPAAEAAPDAAPRPDARARGEWLLGEVSRLVDEANGLAAEGRTIEASAVAALAEWRARSLEHNVQSRPLGMPVQLEKPAKETPAPDEAEALKLKKRVQE